MNFKLKMIKNINCDMKTILDIPLDFTGNLEYINISKNPIANQEI